MLENGSPLFYFTTQVSLDGRLKKNQYIAIFKCTMKNKKRANSGVE